MEHHRPYKQALLLIITVLFSCINPSYGGSSKISPTLSNGKRTLPGLELALAGAAATMIGDAALHPIDCIKTLQQSNNGIGLSMIGAGKKIFADQGIPGFFNGLGCYVACDGAAGAIKFATYEALKNWVNENVSEEYFGTAIFGCAALAFVSSSVVLVPGELIKQRIQMGQVSSVSNGISTIWKNEGFFGFFTGYSGVCLRDIPYTMIELGLYDNLKSFYYKLKNNNLKEEEKAMPLSQVEDILAAAVTGGIAGFLTGPLDMIKTKLMVNSDLYSGFVDCVSKTVTDNGLPSIFQGSGARVAWLVPFTALYLPLYDYFKRSREMMPIIQRNERTEVLNIIGGGTQPELNKKKIRRFRLDGTDSRSFVSF